MRLVTWRSIPSVRGNFVGSSSEPGPAAMKGVLFELTTNPDFGLTSIGVASHGTAPCHRLAEVLPATIPV